MIQPKFCWTKLLTRLLFAVLMCVTCTAFSQDLKRDVVDVKKTLVLRGSKADTLTNDTLNMTGSKTLLTANAVRKYVNARLAVPGPQGEQGLQGIQGLPGTDGAKWFEATAAPNGATGKLGDFYLNRTTGDYYEKTGASIWSIRGNLRGPQGLQGLQGPAGTDGVNGTNGVAGAKGDKGDPGTGIYIKGSLADSTLLPGTHDAGDAYLITGRLWVSDGEEFTNVGNIQGPQGLQGVSGTPGSKWFDQTGSPVGANGTVGDFYMNRTTGDYYEKTGSTTWTLRGNLRGPQGIQGVAGAQGATGATGAPGATGATGAAGAAGTPGSKWHPGSGAPSSSTGIVGDFYLNSVNGDYYEKTGVSAWTLRGNIRGPQGADGSGGGAALKKIIWD